MIIIFIILLCFYLKFSKTEISYFFLFIAIGGILIAVNNLLFFEASYRYFAGSDTIVYYEEAKNFVIKDLTWSGWISSIRYIFYFIFQNLASYPFIENEKYASFLIKLSNLATGLFSIAYFNHKVKNYLGHSLNKNIAYNLLLFASTLCIISISFYNVRDVLLTAFFIILLSELSFERNSKLPLIISIFAVANFRFFYPPVILFAKYLSTKQHRIVITLNKLKLTPEIRYWIMSIVFVLILLTISKIFIPLISAIVMLFTGYPLSVETFNYSIIDFFRSLVAGDPISYWLGFYDSQGRAFVITNINQLFFGFIYLISYFITIYIVLFPLLLLFNQNNNSVYYLKFIKVNLIAIFTLLIIAALNTIFYEGMQERVRVTVMVPVLLAMSLNTVYLKHSKINLLACLFLSILISLCIAIFYIT